MAWFKTFHPAPAPSGSDRMSLVCHFVAMSKNTCPPACPAIVSTTAEALAQEEPANPQLAIANPNKDSQKVNFVNN